ncbi:uncharacterized protein BDZ99DRAFT_447640 [Mytilinidion resinicola]|uniref:PARP catalytic domain-containing protein n=1 Tax=Mytilinidion resinicola TaxID=574789 RepID=A0A6A6YEN6_9PEZI|nr:uncharacterized protein BDZ99DRAFT_447640 [Mytilinidion resinicola]KAF2807292.1 hypothetical protein BDZ99DRAFT_447640 [Mytilinidion resinicola]
MSSLSRTGHLIIDQIIRDVDFRLPPEVILRAYVHTSHFTFGFHEFDLKILVNLEHLDHPMQCHIDNRDLPRKTIDPIRVSLRELLQHKLDDDRMNLTRFDAGMIVLQMVEEATSHIQEYRQSSGQYWDLDKVKNINTLLDPKLKFKGVNLDSVQDCATHILGKTPAQIFHDILPDWRILHCENILRNDLQTNFLLNREEMRKNLSKYTYSQLKSSVPIEHRRLRGSSEASKEQLIEYLIKPRISFHGTRRDLVPSIVRCGFLKPGDVHPITKKPLIVHNGSLYGMGIYSSPDPAYAMLYSGGQSESTKTSALPGMKLIVSAVVMGRAAVIEHEDNWWSRDKPYPGADSHVSAPGNAYIVFNSAQILPCYVLHLDWTGSTAEDTQNFLLNNLSTGTQGKKRRAVAETSMAPGDVLRLKQERLARAQKFFAYGFGPVSGRNIVIEDIGDIDDDEEDYGDYQANRIDATSTQASNPWNWKLDGETAFDEYADARKGKPSKKDKAVILDDGSTW